MNLALIFAGVTLCSVSMALLCGRALQRAYDRTRPVGDAPTHGEGSDDVR